MAGGGRRGGSAGHLDSRGSQATLLPEADDIMASRTAVAGRCRRGRSAGHLHSRGSQAAFPPEADDVTASKMAVVVG